MEKKTVFSAMKLLVPIGVFVIFFCAPVFPNTPQPTIEAVDNNTGINTLNLRAQAGVVNAPAEARITMKRTTVGYEVRQLLGEPPRNAQNQIGWENIQFYGLRNASAAGALFYASRSASPQPLNSFDPLYRNSSGNEDNFILVYSVNVPAGLPSGLYTGQLRFELTPQNSAQTTAYAYLNIAITVDQTRVLPPEIKEPIEIMPLEGLHTIKIKYDKKRTITTADVGIIINAPSREVFSIVQVARDPFLGNDGTPLAYATVNLQAHNVVKGAGTQLISLAGNEEQVLYTSMPDGGAQESFVVTYGLAGDLTKLKEGTYRTTLKYYLRQAGIMKHITDLSLEVEVEGYFEMKITPTDESGKLQFSNIKPGSGPRQQEVVIEVTTNKQTPYQIGQKVDSEMRIAATATVVPMKYFTFQLQGMDTRGKLLYEGKNAVKIGQDTLFTSPDGASDKFKIIYELTVPEDAIGGDYQTRIVYQWTEGN